MSRQGDQVSKRPRPRCAGTRAAGHCSPAGWRALDAQRRVCRHCPHEGSPQACPPHGAGTCSHSHACAHADVLPGHHKPGGRPFSSPALKPSRRRRSSLFPRTRGAPVLGAPLRWAGRASCLCPAGSGERGAGSPGPSLCGSRPPARTPACLCLLRSEQPQPDPSLAGEADRARACSPVGSPCALYRPGPGDAADTGRAGGRQGPWAHAASGLLDTLPHTPSLSLPALSLFSWLFLRGHRLPLSGTPPSLVLMLHCQVPQGPRRGPASQTCTVEQPRPRGHSQPFVPAALAGARTSTASAGPGEPVQGGRVAGTGSRGPCSIGPAGRVTGQGVRGRACRPLSGLHRVSGTQPVGHF